MQTATDAYKQLVGRAEQAPRARVRFDWYRTSEGRYYSGDSVDFEGGTVGSWVASGVAPPTLSVSTSGPYRGTSRGNVAWQTAGGGLLSQQSTNPGPPERDLIPGRIYTASVWVSVNGGGAAPVAITMSASSSGTVLGGRLVTTGSGVYEQLYITFRAGAVDDYPALYPTAGTLVGHTLSLDEIRIDPGWQPMPAGTGPVFTEAYADDITVERLIVTDLDPAVTLISGTAAATATLSLTGDPTDNRRSAGWLYSPYQAASDLVDVDREGVPAIVELGQQVMRVGPPELFTQLVGRVRDMQVAADADGTRAEVQLVDASADLGFEPDLPVAVGNDPVIPPSGEPMRPGLDVQWVVDHIARQGGFYASPPTRAQALLSATLHGSAWPEVGSLRTAFYWDESSTSTAFPVRFAPAKFALGMEDQPFTPGFPNNYAYWIYEGGASASQASGARMFFEAWYYLSPSHNDELGAMYDTSGIGRRIVWRTDGSGHLGLVWNRDGSTVATTYPSTARLTYTGWYYVGWHITYGASTTTIRIRINDTTDTLTPATPSAQAGLSLGQAATYNFGCEALQVSIEPYRSNMWNDAFVPNAVLEPGLSELVAVPPIPAGTRARTLLQDIARATAGVVMVDERGILQSWNRRHWGTAAAATTVQRTLKASVPLKTVTVQSLADRIRNIVRVAVSPFRITPAAVLWSLTELISVPGHGSVTRFIDLSPNQAYQINTAGDVMVGGGSLVNGHSSYRAARRQDGSGGQLTNITMAITPFATAVKIVWSNPNAFPVFLVTPSGVGYPAGSVGLPTAALVGRLITQDATAPDAGTTVASSTVMVEYRDERSISDYGGTPRGEKPLALDPSVWLQNGDDGLALAQEIGFTTSRPCPQLPPVTILGDASLMVGDLVLLDDDSGATGIRDPWWIVGISSRQSGGDQAEATQDLTLRPVARPFSVLTADLATALPDRVLLDGRNRWG